jgi:hypothetical protein
MKIYKAVQKLLVGDTYTQAGRQTDRQTGDLISVLSFLESRLKTVFYSIEQTRLFSTPGIFIVLYTIQPGYFLEI